MLTCKNCQSEFEGNFCPNCGQKYINKRFNLKDSIAWAFHSIFNFDKGFLLTSRDLITIPGKVINGFLNGVTIRYAHPFRFIFIWATISAILGVWAGTFEDTSLAMNEAMGIDQESIQRTKGLQDIMGQYMSFVILFMVPFYALGSYLLFKSKGLNYAEHLIINSFALSSSIMLGVPLTIAYGFYPELGMINGINMGIGVLIVSRVYAQSFKTSWFIAFVKYLLTFLITIIVFAIVMIIVMIIVSIVFHVLEIPNPIIPAKPPA